ncbi:MAG: S66 family peptidase [Candidatus Woesearchaeota archaeon]
MYPPKLNQGDEIRIIAPSSTMKVLSKEFRTICEHRLESIGLRVSYGKYIDDVDKRYIESSSIEKKISDLHDAFKDTNVKAVIPVFGGFNSNQLLRYIDYDLIKKNPKIFCGFSDITALGNAIYRKTGLVTYSGPGFSSFGMKKGGEYTFEYFKKCLMSNPTIDVYPSEYWSDDKWWQDQDKRKFKKNPGRLIINEGTAKGKIIGGNLCTLNLLQGTEYMPDIKDKILFIEDDYESTGKHFDRDFQSLVHLPGFERVKGIIIGRFESASGISNKDIQNIVSNKRLHDIPVIANADFGHTNPLITLPIGGVAELSAYKKRVDFRIIKH